MLVPSGWFRQLLSPALEQCWRRRNFQPAAIICRELTPIVRQFISNGTGEAPITLQVGEGLPFRPELWRMLVGELLLFGAAELPELETPLESYAAVMHQPLSHSRGDFVPIQQAIEGSRDIWFGTYFRPEHAGWNDEEDVQRLAHLMAAIDTQAWNASDLTRCAIDDRDDELAFLREWFPPLREAYRRAADLDYVIACEEL